MERKTWAACLLLAATAPLAAADALNANGLDRKPSGYLNRRLPDWLKFSGEYRVRIEDSGNSGFAGPEDGYLLSRTRLNISIQPATWVQFFGQAQDARAFFQNNRYPAPPYQDTWDIRLAYAEIGKADSGPVMLRVGRQEINLGEQRLVGSLDWTNTARSFDAARLTVHRGGFRLDAFASSVADQRDQELNHHKQGNNFYGLYGGLTSLVPGGTIEPFLFWRVAPLSLSPILEHGGRGKLDQKTVGARWAGKLPRRFDYSIEMARQSGSLGADKIGAWAGHWLLGKSFPAVRWQPRALAEYNYASGDANPNDGRRGTFDQLYPTGHLKYGMTDSVGWRNIHDVHAGVELKPAKRWSANAGVHGYWLASARDGLYAASSALIARSADGGAGKHVGEELEVFGAYTVKETLTVGSGYGHLFSGRFLKTATGRKNYDYPYLMVNYLF